MAAGIDYTTDRTRGHYRRVYSGFIRGRRINSVSLAAEAWFWRLQAIADDFGNFDADPQICHAATVGRRPGVSVQKVESFIGELVKAELLALYTVGDENFAHIVGFDALQPAGKNGKRVKRVPHSPWDGKGESGGIRGNPESPSASHSHSHSHSHTPKAPKGAGGADRRPRRGDPPAGGAGDPEGFMKFWAAWPKHERKVNRGGCLKRWISGSLEPLTEEILRGLNRWKASAQWAKETGRFIPAPLVFLNQERWTSADALDPAEQGLGDNGFRRAPYTREVAEAIGAPWPAELPGGGRVVGE